MKHRLATMSPYRVLARKLIDRVIADNVLGPVGCLPKEDLRELRQILYQTVCFGSLSAWEKKILREEWRITLGHPAKRKPRMKRIHGLAERDVLPSMRDWAIKRGLIQEPETTAAQP